MISTLDRKEALTLIEQACRAGARKALACQELGIDIRTLQRWTREGTVAVDGRTQRTHTPHNKLSTQERATVLAIANEPRFASLPPTQIVPTLADEGRYVASESTFYRVLHEADQQHHRGHAAAPLHRESPRLCATAPNRVWCWDITWLPGPARGMYFFLYLIVDLYSRKIVGWEVHEQECGEHASDLIARAVRAERCLGGPLVYHADNGSPMKASVLQATLDALGVTPSYSRPHVSNDNAYAESLFRTCKYRPSYPCQGFATLEAAREWVLDFVRWYNHEHKHRGLNFVSPHERHCGAATTLMVNRHRVYTQAKARHPQRWGKRATRNWSLPGEVWLNKPASNEAATEGRDRQAA